MTTYSRFIRPLAFRLDPETAHHLAIAAGARLGWAAGVMRAATHVRDDRLATDVAGLHFPTPIGLAAGFDKSGSAIRALAGLGFGSTKSVRFRSIRPLATQNRGCGACPTMRPSSSITACRTTAQM
jgi:hypothetical protein